MRVALSWPVGGQTGWGVCGLGLALAFQRMGWRVVLEGGARGEGMAPWDLGLVRPMLTAPPGPVDLRLVALGNGLQGEPSVGAGDVGLVFAEDTRGPEGVPPHRAVLAGSGWCRDVVRGWGVDAGVFRQAVDPAVFCPGPRPRLFRDHWPVVFSGGKLEYRKGQDIVVAAFRELLAVYPKALLLTAWGNPWPGTVPGIEAAGHVRSVPRETSPQGLTVWLASEGVPAGHHFDVGMVSHLSLAYYLRCADVAVFPNRCEGGTNLVAQECLATGLPVVLSRGTGHLDLIEAPSAVFVKGAEVAKPPKPWRGSDGWVECDPAVVARTVRETLDMEGQAGTREPWCPWTWDMAARSIVDHVDIRTEVGV